jgi:signal transduction histidine kinase
MTSDSSPERATQVLKQGADGYVRKPFDPVYLIDLCEKARRQRSLLRVEELLEVRTKELGRQRADFLAMLAHDIKNPLGVILGCTEILLEEAHDRTTADTVHFLERLQSNALLVHSLVSNYLDFSRCEAGQLILTKQPLDLSTVLLQVVNRYEAEARLREITLTLRTHPEPPPIEGDPLALERIFTNLLHNALKFTPKHGQVTLSTTVQNGEVAVTVSDTGPGIAPHELPTLFERFRRASATRHREGIGLGLFIVKVLVEAHHGRIKVDSTPGQGCHFTVLFSPEATCFADAEVREV